MTTAAEQITVVTITDDCTFLSQPISGPDRVSAFRKALDADHFACHTAGEYDLWFDDDGAITRRPYNLIGSFVGTVLSGGTFEVCGPVLITRAPSGDCADTQSLTPGDVMRLNAWFSEVMDFYDLADV